MRDAHTREPVITQKYLSVLRFCRWFKLVRHQKAWLFGSKIRMEMSHSIFCTNRHKIDVITIYQVLPYTIVCRLVGLNASAQEKTTGFSFRLHKTPAIQLCLLVQQTGTIFADDMYVCIELVFLYSSTFCCDSASEFGAMGSTSFLGFSYPNLLLFFFELLLFLGTCIIFFSQVFGLSLGLLYFSVPYFGLACDHRNSFLCLED